MKRPETRYVALGDADVAFQIVGEGPVDLCYVGGFSHIDQRWEIPIIADAIEGLAAFSRLILFDRRGTGASDAVTHGAVPTWEEWAEDLGTVLDAVGSQRTAIFAEFDGGPIAMLFAAMHPERVTALILSNTAARNLTDDEYAGGVAPAAVDGIVEMVRQAWGTPLIAQLLYPDRLEDPGFVERFARFTRCVATPRSMAAQLRYMLEVDVREALPLIDVPTLVLHNRGNVFIPIHMGRYLADHIADARFVEVAGDDATAGTYAAAIEEVCEFVTGERPVRLNDRVLTTILFTDICGSTERAAALGDSRWRNLLDAHDREVRNQLERFGGREIKTTGDGFLASFDGPARSIRCAKAIIQATQRLGVDLRVGIHTGECEVREHDLGGLAVHIAARIGARAQPNEVLASGTVKDLVVGSDIEFESRGEHELKGVPGVWKLFSVPG